MLAFLFFLAVIYLLVVLAVTLPYWYERGNSPCRDIPAAAYGFRSVCKLWRESALSALKIGIAYPLDPILRHIEKADDHEDRADHPPVLLVHGLYHHPCGWVYMKKALRKTGFHKIHTVGYSSWNTSLKGVTECLENAVAELEKRYPGRKPILVGHSLGGLIIRNWLASGENFKRAFGALTLGAPHRGSKMAALAFGSLGRSLCPENAFFANLAEKEGEAAIPCVSLVSEADTMVLPLENLIPVTRGWAMRITPYATHLGLLTKASVHRMVAWELHRMTTEAKTAAHSAPERETPSAGKDRTVPPPAGADVPLSGEAPAAEVIPAPQPSSPSAPAAAPDAKRASAKTKPAQAPARGEKSSARKAPGKSGKAAAKPARKSGGK